MSTESPAISLAGVHPSQLLPGNNGQLSAGRPGEVPLYFPDPGGSFWTRRHFPLGWGRLPARLSWPAKAVQGRGVGLHSAGSVQFDQQSTGQSKSGDQVNSLLAWRHWPRHCLRSGEWICRSVCLFYILAAFRVISVRTHGDFIVLPHFDWEMRPPAPWPDIPHSHIILTGTVQTSPCPILLMLSARPANNKYQFYVLTLT